MATEPFETDFRGCSQGGYGGWCRIDFGYHFIISTEEQLAGVPSYAADYGAPSFKIFMNNRGGEGDASAFPISMTASCSVYASWPPGTVGWSVLIRRTSKSLGNSARR